MFITNNYLEDLCQGIIIRKHNFLVFHLLLAFEDFKLYVVALTDDESPCYLFFGIPLFYIHAFTCFHQFIS